MPAERMLSDLMRLVLRTALVWTQLRSNSARCDADSSSQHDQPYLR